MYRIKEVSRLTGVSAHAIRFYENMGILPEADRSENGYRNYSEVDVARLRFLHGARQLDMPLNKIAEILALRDEETPTCRHVRELVANKIAEVDRRIQELQRLRDELIELDEVGRNLPENTPCVCQRIGSRIADKRG